MKFPSKSTAFITGLLTPFVVCSIAMVDVDSSISKFTVGFGGFILLAALFMLVHGPAHWDRYRWFPNDGLLNMLIRVLFWLLGALSGVASLELLGTT